MARIVTQEQKARSTGGGQEWTDEQKLEYSEQWKRFAKLMASRPVGAKRNFKAAVLEVSDPVLKERKFQGVSTVRKCRTIKVELREPGLDMLRFITDSADNVQNEKTALNHLYIAVTGETPPREGRFSYDVDDLEGAIVQAVIKKGPAREDGQRGGFYSDLVDFEGVYEDTGIEEELAPTVPAVPRRDRAVEAPKRATIKQATEVDELDEVPF